MPRQCSVPLCRGYSFLSFAMAILFSAVAMLFRSTHSSAIAIRFIATRFRAPRSLAEANPIYAKPPPRITHLRPSISCLSQAVAALCESGPSRCSTDQCLCCALLRSAIAAHLNATPMRCYSMPLPSGSSLRHRKSLRFFSTPRQCELGLAIAIPGWAVLCHIVSLPIYAVPLHGRSVLRPCVSWHNYSFACHSPAFQRLALAWQHT